MHRNATRHRLGGNRRTTAKAVGAALTASILLGGGFIAGQGVSASATPSRAAQSHPGTTPVPHPTHTVYVRDAANPFNTPCVKEDSLGCFWDARNRPNGKGLSYVVTAAGNTFYFDPEYSNHPGDAFIDSDTQSPEFLSPHAGTALPLCPSEDPGAEHDDCYGSAAVYGDGGGTPFVLYKGVRYIQDAGDAAEQQ